MLPRIFSHIPIRTRVALAILSFSASAMAIMSVIVYFSFESRLRSNFDDALRTRAAANLVLVDTFEGQLALKASHGVGDERMSGVSLIRLYGTDGALISDGTSAVGSSPGEAALVQAALRTGTDAVATLSYEQGEAYRVIASPVREAGTVRGVVVSGLETSQIEEPLTILRVALVVAVPLTSLVLAVGAFFIARRALRPIAAISATARRIAHGDLRERISNIKSHDEVGELATTFNDMLERIADTLERERRFTADASHELRTPLTALETTIDVTLAQSRTPTEYERALTAMRAQTARLSTLTRQLMLLSRVDAGSVAPTLEGVDLAAAVDAVVESFRETHPSVTIESTGLDEPLPMRGNFELLVRMFGNVLENAVIHGSADVHIVVTLARVAAMATVTIHDDGPGIPVDLGEAAFQRFRRGDAARTGGGTGLGLAIVQSIARAHGGQVRFLPETQGATIEISLPTLMRS